MRKTSFIFAGIMATIIGTAYAVGENTVASKAYVDTKQVKIPAAGTNANTPGESVVTYTDTAGTIGERGIFDWATGWDGQNEEIVEGHEGDLVTADDIIYDIYDSGELIGNIRGSAGTVVVRDGDGKPYASADIYDGSTTYNAQDNADDLITAGAVQGQISGINTDITNVNNSITNINNDITSINNQMNAMPLETIEIQKLTCANPCSGRNCQAGTYCTLWTIGDAGVAHKLYSCTAQTVATDCPACGTGTVKACVDGVCKCNACKADGVVASNSSECCSGFWGHEQQGDHICCGTPGSGIGCATK